MGNALPRQRSVLLACGLAGAVMLACGSAPRGRAGLPASGDEADSGVEPVSPYAPDCVRIEPAFVDFGDAFVGCQSAEQLVTVTNTCDTGTMAIDAIDVTDEASSFILTRRPALPARLPAHGSVEIAVVFKPSETRPEAALAIQFVGQQEEQGPVEIALTGQGVPREERVDTFGPLPRPKVDLLFVIDDGPAMADKEAWVACNLADLFHHEVVPTRVDYHIGITTTSTREPDGAAGRLLAVPESQERFLTRTTPNAEQKFAQMVAVGSSGDPRPQLLRPIELALSEPLTSGVNAGFLREDARLAVIIVSASDDDDPLPISHYEQFLSGLKTPRDIESPTVSAAIPTCLQYDSGNGCAYLTEDAGASRRVRDVVTWSEGMLDEICNRSFLRPIEKGTSTFSLHTDYPLSHAPDMTDGPESLRVEIDGVEYPQYGPKGDKRWDFDAAALQVVFDPLAAPSDDATVTIRYRPSCEP